MPKQNDKLVGTITQVPQLSLAKGLLPKYCSSTAHVLPMSSQVQSKYRQSFSLVPLMYCPSIAAQVLPKCRQSYFLIPLQKGRLSTVEVPPKYHPNTAQVPLLLCHLSTDAQRLPKCHCTSTTLVPSMSRSNTAQNEDSTHSRIENMDAESISSEGSVGKAFCGNSQPVVRELLWEKENIALALENLPAGKAALTTLPTVDRNQLSSVIERIKYKNFPPKVDSLELIPKFANGCLRKDSFIAENEEALASTPDELLMKWPNTCLLVSCWFGQIDIVKLLLQKGAQVSYCDCDGRTSLHLAASIGSVEIVEEILKYNADPNTCELKKNYTPLHCAAAAGNADTVRCLLKAGADINIGLSGKSPLYYAVQNAGQNKDVSCVRILLEAGASPNNPQVYTETPLHVAASLGLAECIELLLKYGADVRVQFGNERSTPLHLAAEEGNLECTRLLLQAGAIPDVTNSRGQTALHLAALSQSAETLDILIGAGANVNAGDDNGRSPLHTAVAKAVRGSDLIRILISGGALVNKPDKFGYTPLHIAALNENSSIVTYLLEKGADVTARTKGDVSALSFIVRRTPDVLTDFVTRLDQAVALHDHELGDVDCELQLDFRPLVPGVRSESDLMICLVEVGQRHILKHPLCESFLYLKWLKIRKFLLFSLIFHSVFVTIFTSYVAVTYLWEIARLSRILFWFVLLFTLMLASKELFQVAHGVCLYAKGWENVLQWSVILLTATVLAEPPDDWEQHVVALSSLFVWLELMMVVGRFPMFGLYVQMFTQVAINFFKFLGAYLCVIVGFSLAFSVLHKNRESFSNPFVSFLKTVVMLSGELEFEDVFYDNDAPILYPGTAHLMWLVFIILITVILANLMMGLAVSDIQELRQSAGLDRLVRRAELVTHLESLLFSKLLDYAPKRVVQACRSSALLLHRPHHCAFHIRPNDPREKRLPRELVKAIYRLVIERKSNNKLSANSLTRNLNSDEFKSHQMRRFYSNSSFNGNNGQIGDPETELKKFALTIESKLNELVFQVNNLTKNNNVVNVKK
ncbi:transient receptor potential channel pyrexia-like [Copidosoma floridanum]|uniref:transient receptor potential channel pyrexia-like n=1 Tax=Copidosoma floridanum TaxID=29053 RepID=UPI000C6F7378|nr:transient receptor potential channel pyrexia-like [Copidosoma floridanum]